MKRNGVKIGDAAVLVLGYFTIGLCVFSFGALAVAVWLSSPIAVGVITGILMLFGAVVYWLTHTKLGERVMNPAKYYGPEDIL